MSWQPSHVSPLHLSVRHDAGCCAHLRELGGNVHFKSNSCDILQTEFYFAGTSYLVNASGDFIAFSSANCTGLATVRQILSTPPVCVLAQRYPRAVITHLVDVSSRIGFSQQLYIVSSASGAEPPPSSSSALVAGAVAGAVVGVLARPPATGCRSLGPCGRTAGSRRSSSHARPRRISARNRAGDSPAAGCAGPSAPPSGASRGPDPAA